MQATFCLKVGQTVQAEIPPSALDALPWRFTQPQAPLQTAAWADTSVQVLLMGIYRQQESFRVALASCCSYAS